MAEVKVQFQVRSKLSKRLTAALQTDENLSARSAVGGGRPEINFPLFFRSVYLAVHALISFMRSRGPLARSLVVSFIKFPG